MQFHTCILQGRRRINFMTHSSVLISNANCSSGILSNQKLLGRASSQKENTKANTSKCAKLSISSCFHSIKLSFSCFFPREIHTEKPKTVDI